MANHVTGRTGMEAWTPAQIRQHVEDGLPLVPLFNIDVIEASPTRGVVQLREGSTSRVPAAVWRGWCNSYWRTSRSPGQAPRALTINFLRPAMVLVAIALQAGRGLFTAKVRICEEGSGKLVSQATGTNALSAVDGGIEARAQFFRPRNICGRQPVGRRARQQEVKMKSRDHRGLGLALSRLALLLAVLIGLDCHGASAQTGATDTTGMSPIGTKDFHYNMLRTTPFGPAAADILVKPANMMSCKPPTSKPFSYALCFYSGPAVATGTQGNPALPCTLSADGKSANCTCLKLTAAEYPTDPYIVDINAILNLDVYRSTVSACGHDGSKCSRVSTATNPACAATNAGTMMPVGNLISVFSTVKKSNYTAGTTFCPAGKYAGCMTAPCLDTGKKDASGAAVVQCQCPVYDGPYQVGQADASCDANALTPASGPTEPNGYVWSAGYSPSQTAAASRSK